MDVRSNLQSAAARSRETLRKRVNNKVFAKSQRVADFHKSDCVNILKSRGTLEEAARFVKAEWESGFDSDKNNSAMYEAPIQLYVSNRIGVAADITRILAEMHVMILQINTQNKNDGLTIINLKVSCKNIEHYNTIVSKLRAIESVESIARAYNS